MFELKIAPIYELLRREPASSIQPKHASPQNTTTASLPHLLSVESNKEQQPASRLSDLSHLSHCQREREKSTLTTEHGIVGVNVEENNSGAQLCCAPTDTKHSFQQLMRRKLGQVSTGKSAFCVMSMCLYYCLKLKKMANMKKSEKEHRVKTLKLEYENIKRDYFAFLPTCQLRCGLLPNLSCGRQHKTQTQQFFHPRLNFSYCWPALNRAEIQLSDLLSVLKTDTHSLGYTWDPNTHPQILLEYVYTLMSCQQTGVKPVRGLDTVRLQFHQDMSGCTADDKNSGSTEHKGILTVGVGRPQSTILGDQHTILGSGIFRILSLQGSFGLSMLTMAHVRANHKRQRTKSLLLRMGFSTGKLESLLYSQQQNCDFCRRKKAARKNKSLGMAVSAGGSPLVMHSGIVCYIAFDKSGAALCLSC